MWSIERRHFQWPWTTPNLVFKVTPFFDTEYRWPCVRCCRSTSVEQPTIWHSNIYTIIRHVQETSEILPLSTVFFQPVELVTTCTLTIFRRSRSSSCRLLRPINCQTYITLHLTNGYRYSHIYYGRWIGNRTQTFKWYHFQWLSVTSNPHFKVKLKSLN